MTADPPGDLMTIHPMLLSIVFVTAIVALWIAKCLNILREYERGVVFRFGHLRSPDKGPGLVLIPWPIDTMVRVSFRVVTWEVPPQDIITRDNVSLKVNAVVYFRVVDATKSVVAVENFRFAVEQAAQTGLRSEERRVGKACSCRRAKRHRSKSPAA